MPDTPVVLLVEDDPQTAERHAEWLADDYEVRTVISGESALEQFDADVDVVVLDRQLPDMSGGGLLGRLRAREGDPAVGMLLGIEPDRRVLQLDVDEFGIQPLDREDYRALIASLDRRRTVDGAVEAYLSLLDRKRELESSVERDALKSDPEYRTVAGELLARRRQLESVLDRIQETDTDGPDASTTPEVPALDSAAADPLYRRRPAEFYGLWFVAALTYGVGDVISTLYAVFGVPGISEANPVVDALLANFGIPGFLFLKLLVFLVLISVSVQGARTADRFSYYWPPLLASGVGIALTAWNVSLVLGTS